MWKELKQTVNQTKDVEGQIRSALQTPMKRGLLWIITESDYDRRVYERFFGANVAVRPAYDEKGQGGCDHVLRIVRNILKDGATKRIIGIRDADYQYYLPKKYVYPSNLFHTDERDIEMMMLKSASVQRGLASWSAVFPVKIEVVKPVACYLGKIRIWHVAHDISASIKRYKIAKVWDYLAVPQRLKNGWKRILMDQYNRLTGESVNPKRLSVLKKRYGLDDIQYGRICRGHDFVQLLGIAMVDSRYSSKEIQEKMTTLYSKPDFAATNLAQNIQAFANRFGMRVM